MYIKSIEILKRSLECNYNIVKFTNQDIKKHEKELEKLKYNLNETQEECKEIEDSIAELYIKNNEVFVKWIDIPKDADNISEEKLKWMKDNNIIYKPHITKGDIEVLQHWINLEYNSGYSNNYITNTTLEELKHKFKINFLK